MEDYAISIEHNGENIELDLKIGESATWKEALDSFSDFLRACGYKFSDADFLEWAKGKYELPETAEVLGYPNMEHAESAYCVKCRQKTTMKDQIEVKMKNGRPAIKGKCSVCSIGVYKIMMMANHR